LCFTYIFYLSLFMYVRTYVCYWAKKKKNHIYECNICNMYVTYVHPNVIEPNRKKHMYVCNICNMYVTYVHTFVIEPKRRKRRCLSCRGPRSGLKLTLFETCYANEWEKSHLHLFPLSLAHLHCIMPEYVHMYICIMPEYVHKYLPIILKFQK
jgi:hypothetical protein